MNNTGNFRSNTLKDIERILYGFEQGKFDRIKIAYLLIKLRAFTFQNKIMWDIASFIAHDNREWGITYENAQSKVDNLLLLMKPERQKDGLNLITKGQFLVDQEDFIQEIERLLSQMGFEFQFEKFSYHFMAKVLENLAGSQLIIRNKTLKKQLAVFEVSSVQEDDIGRKTIYAKATPYANRLGPDGSAPQITMDGRSSIGFPILQAVPMGKTAKYDPFVYIGKY